MSDLKPCPFCGGKAEIQHTEKRSEYGECAFIVCTHCGANGQMVTKAWAYSADEKAIEAWNRRAGYENNPLLQQGLMPAT